MIKDIKISPVVKWAGGKRQLLSEIKELMPKSYNSYFEPFIGGGAVYCDLQPDFAVINDANYQLVNLYRCIQTDSDSLCFYLTELERAYNSFVLDSERKEFYYTKRQEFNDFLGKDNYAEDGTMFLSWKAATLFIFLNKTCFNGIYRVNSKGLFNVPWGQKKHVSLYDFDNMIALSNLLKNAAIYHGDFEIACRAAGCEDFVFFDSPYYDTFDTYQAGGFSEEDHIRLCELYKSLTDKGVYCMLTNNNCDFIKDLYKDFNITEVDVKRMINCDSSNRIGKEVIITNYES